MNRRTILLLSLFLLLFPITISRAAQDKYIFELITKEAGFSFSSVKDIATDKNNMLWFGCENGLYYYDNDTFKRYQYQEGDETTISSNFVNGLYNDSMGRMWVCSAGGLDYYDFASDSFVRVKYDGAAIVGVKNFAEIGNGRYVLVMKDKLYTLDLGKEVVLSRVESAPDENISKLYAQSNDRIYIGSRSGKIYTTTFAMDKFKLLYESDIHHSVLSICENDDRLYVAILSSGIEVVDARRGTFMKRYGSGDDVPLDSRLPSNEVRDIVAREGGDVWVATSTGLAIITPSEMTVVRSTPFNALPRNSIFSLHVDSYNSVWLGTWAGNVAYYNDANFRFRSSNDIVLSRSNSYGIGLVYHFAPNDESTVWAASEWRGLSLFDFTENRVVAQYGQNLHIKSIVRDSNGDLWIGTIRQGLYRFDTKSRRMTKIDIQVVDLSEHIISDVMVSNDGERVWIGTREGGLLSYSIKSGESRLLDIDNVDGINSNAVWGIQSYDGGVLVATDDGLMFDESGDGGFKHFAFDVNAGVGQCIYSVVPSAERGEFYLATKEHGIQIFNAKSREYEPFEKNDRISHLEIYDIVLDGGGNMWFSTDDGVFRYDRMTRELRGFTMDNGLNTSRFHPGSCCVSDGDVLFFGSTNGFNYIAADRVTTNNIIPHAYISQVRVNGRELSPQNCRYVNSWHSADITDLELTHYNNTLIFNIVSDNVLKAGNDEFRYRLVGYDDEWQNVEDGENVVFTKVPFGRYIFEVGANGNDGVWGETRRVNLHILSPLYLRWYSILIYIAVVVVLSLFIIREMMFRMKVKREIELEREINIVNSRSFDEKVKFFMNVSHELRTPLSLIFAPLNMLEREVTTRESKMHFNAIKRNAKRLLTLTNQILDFRLLEVGRLAAVRSCTNIVDLCRESSDYFEYQLVEHNLSFEFKSSDDAICASVDSDMIGKSVYNLLSNALKYTADGGSIELSIERMTLGEDGILADLVLGDILLGDVVVVTVKDSGCGIEQESLPKIFDRFYFDMNENYSSSGIGLHMCKEYTLLNGGNIAVTSRKGEGTSVVLVLPLADGGADERVAQPLSVTPMRVAEVLDKSEQENEMASAQSGHRSTILIVEDSAELRFYLKQILSRVYNCLTAKNGQQGFEMAREVQPDIVVMDMLMPIVGGAECVGMMRDCDETKLIPIIMLSSLTDDQSVVKAMKSGADAYLAKPVNEALLFAHIERLLTKPVEQLREDVAEVGKGVKRGFFATFESIVEQNMQNSMLDVNLITEIMQISRSTLQRSVKSECGMGVAEYVRDYRLRGAVKLMNSGVYNVDELSVCVGFNSTSYFCKAFKIKYGESPKRYCDILRQRR